MDSIVQYWRIFGEYIPVLIISIVLLILINLIVYFVKIKKTTRREAFYTSILELGTCIFVVIIGLMTLLPTRSKERYIFDSSINVEIIFNRDIEGLINLIIFIPLFFILKIRFNRVSPLIFVLISFGLSVFIEFLQYILPLGRIATVNDVILNTIGSTIGLLLAVLMLKLSNKSSKQR